jgi:hypothetical protein
MPAPGRIMVDDGVVRIIVPTGRVTLIGRDDMSDGQSKNHNREKKKSAPPILHHNILKSVFEISKY